MGIPFGSEPATCAVEALRAWLDAAGITSGPVFRNVNRWERVAGDAITPQTVVLSVKAAAGRVGLDPEALARHSLRSGC